ncbi:MAG: septum site-determining protein MinC [Gallionellaceae bacterium]|nr:septum site-determining protein MinC [Gallionellaceae bacterium]
MPKDTPALKIKNASLPLFVLHAMTPDMALFKAQLEAHLAQMPDFFAGAPVALGLAAIADSDTTPDFAHLAAFMRSCGMAIAGVIGGSEAQRAAARAAGLGLFPEGRAEKKPVVAPPPEPTPEPQPAPESVPEAPATVVEAPPAAAPPRRPTLVIDKPVRAGQRIHAEGGDLVVLAIVNAGAELIADGDIHVYAPLRGRALAGARGDTGARIFAQCMEAELVSIAGYFQVFEDGIPAPLRSKSVQVFLDGEQVTLAALTSVR